MTRPQTDVLAVAREQVLEPGAGLSEQQVLAVLELADDRLDELLELSHRIGQLSLSRRHVPLFGDG